jgi:hypothetical protein
MIPAALRQRVNSELGTGGVLPFNNHPLNNQQAMGQYPKGRDMPVQPEEELYLLRREQRTGYMSPRGSACTQIYIHPSQQFTSSIDILTL